MTKIDQLCKLAQAAVGMAPYPYDGSGTQSYAQIMAGYDVDCSGFIVAVLKQIKVSSYHGSNTIWRKYLTESGSISNHGSSNGYPKDINPLSSKNLQRGMVVFKWNSSKPPKYNDSLGDYQHIGFVTSVTPLRIVHSTSVDHQGVTVDTKIGKWCAWGRHKGLNYHQVDNDNNTNAQENDVGGGQTMYKAQVMTNGGSLNVRNSPNGKVLTKIPNGTVIDVTQQSNGWAHISNGWVSMQYIHRISPVDDSVQYDDSYDDSAQDDQQEKQDVSTDQRISGIQQDIRLLTMRLSALQVYVTSNNK